jgi:hypothetical protein
LQTWDGTVQLFCFHNPSCSLVLEKPTPSEILNTCLYLVLLSLRVSKDENSISGLQLTGFTVGSLICSLANSSIMFILGRTVAGIGGAALAPGVMLILTDVVPREKRPLYTGLLAASGGWHSIAIRLNLTNLISRNLRLPRTYHRRYIYHKTNLEVVFLDKFANGLHGWSSRISPLHSPQTV